jgi:transposase
MKEQQKHIEAFEYYYGKGDTRGYRDVAQHFGISLTSVTNWAKAFNWQERVEQRNIEVAKKLEAKTISTVVNEKANYRKIIKAQISNYVKRLSTNEIKIESVADFERLVKLDLLLMGEGTENVHHSGEVNTTTTHNIADWLEGDEDARQLIKKLHRKRLDRSGKATSKD